MKKGKIFKNLHMLCIIFLIFMVVGCGSNNDSVNDEGGIAFQGTVTAPLGAVAHLKGREGLFRKVFPCAFAGVTGLEAVPGASVELIKVDEKGNQVGDVLASTITSTTGHYILRLPVGFDFSAKLVVRVTGTNAVTMKAQVVCEEVDIDPISEYIFRTLTTDGNTLDNIAANEVLRLRGYVEEFDFLAAADINATLAAINTEVKGADFDEIIAEIQQPDGDAADIAGEYFIPDMSMQIATWPGNLAFLDLGEIRIQKTNGGDAAITNAHYNDNQMVLEALMDPQQVTYTLRVEYDDEYSDQSVNLHLDNEGTVTVFWPMEESIYCDGNVGVGMRWGACTEYFYPFSYDENNGVYVTSFIETGTQYSLNAEETALDLSNPIGSQVNYCFGFLSQKAPVTNDALDDNIYGCVGFGQQYENNGDREIFSDMGTLTLSSTGDTTGTVGGNINLMALSRKILSNYPNVALSWNAVTGGNIDDPNGVDEQFTDDYQLNITTGELTISDGDDQFEGYVGNGGDVILIPQFQTTRNEENEEIVDDARLELLCGVKLSSSGSNPNILGKSYRVFSLEGGFSETGRNEIIRMEDGEATINDGTTITFSGTEIYAWKTDDFKVDNFTLNTEAIESETADYAFSGTNGAITITEGDLTKKGYMNYNGSIGVFRVYESNLAQGGYATLGIVVLVEKAEGGEG